MIDTCSPSVTLPVAGLGTRGSNTTQVRFATSDTFAFHHKLFSNFFIIIIVVGS